MRNYIYFTLTLLRNPPPSSCHKLSILIAKDFSCFTWNYRELFCLSLRGVALRTTENCSTSQGEPQASMRINMGPYSQAKLSGFWTSLSIRCCVSLQEMHNHPLPNIKMTWIPQENFRIFWNPSLHNVIKILIWIFVF